MPFSGVLNQDTPAPPGARFDFCFSVFRESPPINLSIHISPLRTHGFIILEISPGGNEIALNEKANEVLSTDRGIWTKNMLS
jgi:hypothetical protein